MLKWKNEIKFNARYGFSGILNSLVGIGTIWVLTVIGIMPVVANVVGFSVGMIFAFLISKKFVFKSQGRFSSEAIKYVVVFIASYLINIAVLQICISIFLINVLSSQGIAIFCYVISMYLALRLYVFRGSKI